ncbi:hypothetical protein OCH7691_04462 [Oceanibacterium hippocampi]|uniref:Uncharacterized protein n=2 Tax=Oceanibacterium hippocampi TaxID=745714 RepID=A0A1Y5U2Y5_9PROT|nr:hypothetical protein OCH7691_04462 [Oceanibacterium hippocampi]
MVKTAVDIEDLVIWTYQAQRADVIEGWSDSREGDWLAGGNRTIEAVLIERGAIGCEIDTSPVPASSRLHPDAEAIHEAVTGLGSRIEIGLLIQHGRAGTRPDWLPAARTRIVPAEMRWSRRHREYRPRIEYDRNRNPVCCPVRIVDHPQKIEAARTVYAIWREALADLAEVFRLHPARLRDHAVAGPRAPARPWEAASAPAGRDAMPRRAYGG